VTDRTVQIRLIGQFQGYLAQVKAAEVATMRFVGTLEKSAAKRAALNDLGSAAGKFGLAAAVGFGLAVKSAASFDHSMSAVKAVLDKTDLGKFGKLRDLAIQQGKVTKFSASEAAQGVEELAKAGVSAADILGGGLKGALSLAAAGNISVKEASEDAATALTQFGLAGSAVPHVADLLSAAANKAQGEVTDMATSLKYVGPVAHSMGVSIEETVGTIAELAHAGILGDQAGTSLRGMLTALTSPSRIASKEMQKLGINVYDAQGQFVGLRGIAGQLRGSMKDLTNAERDQAFGRIFGNQQITAARVLYAGGAKAVDEWTRKVNDSGNAARTAAIKMDNFQGDLEQLRGSLETASIGAGGGAQGPLREMTQDVTALVNAYISLPGPLKSAGTQLLGFGAILGLGTFALTRTLTGIASTRANMDTLGLSARGLKTKLDGPRLALMEMGDSFRTTSAESGKLKGTLSAATTGVSQFGRTAARGAAGAAALGLALTGVTSKSNTAGQATTVLAGALTGFAITGGPWGAVIGGGIGLLSAFGHASEAAAKKQASAAAATDLFSTALDKQTGALTASGQQMLAQKLAQDGVVKAAQAMSVDLSNLTGAMSGNTTAGDDFAQSLGTTRDRLYDIGKAAQSNDFDTFNSALAEAGKIAPENTQQFLKLAAAFYTNSKAARGQRGALGDTKSVLSSLGSVTKSATLDVDKFTDSILKAHSAILEARGGMRGYEAALDDATKALKDNNKTLDIGTEKGRNNQAALDQIASSALDVASGMKQGSDKQRAFLAGAQGQYAKMAHEMGMPIGQAKALAARILGIPSKKDIRLATNLKAIYGDLLNFKQIWDLVRSKTVTLAILHTSHGSAEQTTSGGLRFAEGGVTRRPVVMVGERGPELAELPIGTRIYAHGTKPSWMRDGDVPGFARGGEVGAALRGFNINGIHQSSRDVADELHQLLIELRKAFGPDSRIVNATERLGKHMVEVAAREDKVQASLEKARQSRAQLASDAGGSFDHDIFHMGLRGGITQLRADRFDSLRMKRLLARARRLGVHGNALAALASSGDLDFVSQLDTRREAHQFQGAFFQRRQAQRALGVFAGNAVYGREIKRLNHNLDRLERRLNHLDRDVYHGVRDGMNDVNKAAARHRRV
jgi:TP901 family phage tail tape measure protein